MFDVTYIVLFTQDLALWSPTASMEFSVAFWCIKLKGLDANSSTYYRQSSTGPHADIHRERWRQTASYRWL